MTILKLFLYVEIRKPNIKPFIISACYRAPRIDGVFFNAINQLIAIVDVEDKELILLGDLNIYWIPNSYHRN